MKKLAFAVAAAVLGTAAPAFAQMMQNPPQGQPAPQQMPAQFSPDNTRGPNDQRGLEASIKANNTAWNQQDVQAILNAWIFPATVVTTDGPGNPVYTQVDDAALRAAFTALMNAIPKPAAGQRAAEFKFAGQKIDWVSHQLAVVTYQVNLTQGTGKNMFRKNWKVSQIWTRDPAGWRIRGYVGSGWGDLLKH